MSVFYLRRILQTHSLILWMILTLGYQVFIQFRSNDIWRTRGCARHSYWEAQWVVPHSCSRPFSGQGMPVPTTSGPSIHLRHYRKTTARATHHPSFLVFMKTTCLPLALLRPQNRKYHHCLGSVTNLSVNVYIFLSHLLKYGLLGDFYRRLIISICADFC